MADARVDDRDLRLVLGALNEFLADAEFELTDSERQSYERLCKAASMKPAAPFEQQSLGLLGDNEPPHPDEPPARGIMADYIERTRGWFGGGAAERGVPWPPHPPAPDPAKAIADKMARASHDAATGKNVQRPSDGGQEKRALTDEEKAVLRRALGEE